MQNLNIKSVHCQFLNILKYDFNFLLCFHCKISVHIQLFPFKNKRKLSTLCESIVRLYSVDWTFNFLGVVTRFSLHKAWTGEKLMPNSPLSAVLIFSFGCKNSDFYDFDNLPFSGNYLPAISEPFPGSHMATHFNDWKVFLSADFLFNISQ